MHNIRIISITISRMRRTNLFRFETSKLVVQLHRRRSREKPRTERSLKLRGLRNVISEFHLQINYNKKIKICSYFFDDAEFIFDEYFLILKM